MTDIEAVLQLQVEQLRTAMETLFELSDHMVVDDDAFSLFNPMVERLNARIEVVRERARGGDWEKDVLGVVDGLYSFGGANIDYGDSLRFFLAAEMLLPILEKEK